MRRWTALTYIDYLNAFHRYCKEKYLPGNAKLLYFELLALFNEAYWPDSLQVDNLRLMSLVDTRTERVAISARDKLVDAGFIWYRKGKKRSPNTYYLLEYTHQKVSEFNSENGSISESETTSGLCSHIKKKTEEKEKTFFSGGDGGAAPAPAPVSEATAAVGECLLERDIDKSLYFGMTDAVQGEAAQITDELFSKFGWGTPGAVDISKVLDYTCHREGVRDETQITFQKERVKLLTYAFEQAAKKGEPRNWNYIDGVMRKLARRGIDTVEKAEDYDYEREARE